MQTHRIAALALAAVLALPSACANGTAEEPMDDDMATEPMDDDMEETDG